MPRSVRHDAITLHTGVQEEDFERFMKEELIPWFSDHFGNRITYPFLDLKSQTLLKGTEDDRKWLWVTAWEGDAIQDTFFTVRVRVEQSVAGKIFEMQKRLESFGQCATEEIFSEINFTEVHTST